MIVMYCVYRGSFIHLTLKHQSRLQQTTCINTFLYLNAGSLALYSDSRDPKTKAAEDKRALNSS